MLSFILKDYPNLLEEYNVEAVPLYKFPYDSFDHTNPNGKNGPIHFYNVNPDTKVFALDETSNKIVLADVKSWSEHPDRIVEIVNLANGLQIITDNDPRAVYGVRYENLINDKLIYERMTPTDAWVNNLYVPTTFTYDKIKSNQDYKIAVDMERLNEDIKKEAKDKSMLWTCMDYKHNIYQYTNGAIMLAITAKSGEWELRQIDLNEEIDENNFIVKDNIAFVKIKDVEYTNKAETGYDLTVPGYETFLSVDGIVLSNTMNVHVPGTSGAIQDVIEKLMPDKQVFSIRSPGDAKVVNAIKQEFLSGLYTANKRPGKLYKFNSKAEALDAIKRGLVKLNDDIEIVG